MAVIRPVNKLPSSHFAKIESFDKINKQSQLEFAAYVVDSKANHIIIIISIFFMDYF
ncbi:hypothetical protein J5751_00260 [bacterium]|nr:hypothetical protein [bacterium]